MLTLSAHAEHTSGLRSVHVGCNNMDTSTVIDIVPFHNLMGNIPKDIEDLFEYTCVHCCPCLVEERVNVALSTYIILTDDRYKVGIWSAYGSPLRQTPQGKITGCSFGPF
jgi:hypothetical protein